MKFSKEEIRKSMLLYAVTDRSWLKEGEMLTQVCEKVLKSGATFLQIREKDLDPETFEREAEELKALCRSLRVPFVVNDSVEIAVDIDADGVHVGQSDIKGRDIRYSAFLPAPWRRLSPQKGQGLITSVWVLFSLPRRRRRPELCHMSCFVKSAGRLTFLL